MISRDVSFLLSERTNKYRVAFDIQHIYNSIPGQSQLALRNFKNNAIPFVIILMSQYGVPIIPRIVWLCTVSSFYPFKNFLPVHKINTFLSHILANLTVFHSNKAPQYIRIYYAICLILHFSHSRCDFVIRVIFSFIAK